MRVVGIYGGQGVGLPYLGLATGTVLYNVMARHSIALIYSRLFAEGDK